MVVGSKKDNELKSPMKLGVADAIGGSAKCAWWAATGTAHFPIVVPRRERLFGRWGVEGSERGRVRRLKFQ